MTTRVYLPDRRLQPSFEAAIHSSFSLLQPAVKEEVQTSCCCFPIEVYDLKEDSTKSEQSLVEKCCDLFYTKQSLFLEWVYRQNKLNNQQVRGDFLRVMRRDFQVYKSYLEFKDLQEKILEVLRSCDKLEQDAQKKEALQNHIRDVENFRPLSTEKTPLL
jgi:hypothetical protein